MALLLRKSGFAQERRVLERFERATRPAVKNFTENYFKNAFEKHIVTLIKT